MNADSKQFDILIIGGGLHGSAIAADCAGRGLRTLLCDKGDVGGSHNIISNRLFHCGLQYLQRGDLSCATKSIDERTILQQRAPHLTHPITVAIPQKPGILSSLKSNTSAFLYKLVAGQDSKLEVTDLADSKLAEPLAANSCRNTKRLAIQFEDIVLNDSRLTIENLKLAEEKGATILPYTRLVTAERSHGQWHLELRDSKDEYSSHFRATCVINVAGPETDNVQKQILGIQSRCQANNYVAGYLVVPSLFEGEHAYLLEDAQHHLVGVLPYQQNYSLIGPVIFQGDTGDLSGIPQKTKQLLLELVNSQFKKQLVDSDVLHTYKIPASSYKEAPEDFPTPFSQDYVLDFNCSDGSSPSVSLFGACINMHRLISEQVIEQLLPYLPDNHDYSESWTASASLPGSPTEEHCGATFLLKLADQYSWLPSDLLQRYFSLYGSRCLSLLKDCGSINDLGEEIVPGLYEKEISWLHQTEWAWSADAIIWHRTKLGLQLSNQEISVFNQWFNTHFTYQTPLLGIHLHTEINKQAS